MRRGRVDSLTGLLVVSEVGRWALSQQPLLMEKTQELVEPVLDRFVGMCEFEIEAEMVVMLRHHLTAAFLEGAIHSYALRELNKDGALKPETRQ